MHLDDLSIRIDQLIKQSQEVLTSATSSHHVLSDDVDSIKMSSLRAASLSFITMTYGSNHSHFLDFDTNTKKDKLPSAQKAHGILLAIQDEIKGGWIFSAKQLISAEIFSDFLEMAEHLLAKDYKDPAAVMIGGVLEEKLRQLCSQNTISLEYEKDGKLIHKTADMLNADLLRAEIYNKLDLKQVTAWLDLRNKAAHGNYNDYTKEQVVLMFGGVINFIARVNL